jgi:hypothetical protein
MTAKQHFFLYFFLIIAVPTFAQITKGFKTIGSANLGFQSNSSSSKVGNNETFNSNNFQLGLNLNGPFYMVTNRLQLGVGIGYNFTKFPDYKPYSTSQSTAIKHSFSFSPEIDYYFTKNNGGFYVYAGGNINPYTSTVTNDDNPNEFVKESGTYNSWHAGLGYLLPVNENVFLTAQLNFYKRYSYNSLSVSVSLRNFVPKILVSKGEETPEFIKVGRSIVDGYFAMGYSSFFDENNFSIGASYSQLKFLNNHLAFGGYGSVSGQFNKPIGNYYSLSGGVKARYYIRMTPRLFIYPELGLGLDLNIDKTNMSNNARIVFTKSVGFNYFITQNVAIDANIDLGFSRYENNDPTHIYSSSNFNSNLRFGVIYFIDKLF